MKTRYRVDFSAEIMEGEHNGTSSNCDGRKLLPTYNAVPSEKSSVEWETTGSL
jgi:hypothetical protein